MAWYVILPIARDLTSAQEASKTVGVVLTILCTASLVFEATGLRNVPMLMSGSWCRFGSLADLSAHVRIQCRKPALAQL